MPPSHPRRRRVVLATDFDRTFTRMDLKLSPDAVAAARRVRAAGVGVLLVTGRREEDLPRAGVDGCFDAFVLEGGAVWGEPGAWHFRGARPALWQACDAVERAGIAAERGRASFSAPAEAASLLQPWLQDLSVHPNAGRVDVASAGIDKGYGLSRALRLLGWEGAWVVAVGDSANDIPLFEAASESVAVGNAVPELARRARHRSARVADQGFLEAAERAQAMLATEAEVA